MLHMSMYDKMVARRHNQIIDGVEKKHCPCCDMWKNATKEDGEREFPLHKSRPGGLGGYCLDCMKKRPRKSRANGHELKTITRDTEEGKEKLCCTCSEWKDFSQFRSNKSIKDERHCGISKQCTECYDSNKYYKKDKHKKRKVEHNAKLYENNKKEMIRKHVEYKRKRMKEDPAFRMKCNMGSRLSHLLSGNGMVKPETTLRLVGCSLDVLRFHVENQFVEGMSWSNYGRNTKSERKWVLDHIQPMSSFNVLEETELRKACHYTNLQPMWDDENLKKSDFVEGCDSRQMKETIKEKMKEFEEFKNSLTVEDMERFKNFVSQKE